MPIVKCDNFIDVYRLKAQAGSVHEMSGRTGRHDLTLFVNQRIVEKMRFAQTDHVVDIGCGDGTLLTLVATHNVRATGILPSEEEAKCLSGVFTAQSVAATIDKGTAQALPLPDNSADKIVCNGVLLLLDGPDIDRALNEILRVARRNALIYIGEIPSVDEFADRDHGDSVRAWLVWVVKRHGIRAFVRSAWQVLEAAFSSTPFIIAPKQHFHATPEDFIARAQSAGLTTVEYFPHLEIEPGGEVRRSASRWDYLLRVT